ncbi:unnamed protein product, partial [Nesidiocoris tenuis]
MAWGCGRPRGQQLIYYVLVYPNRKIIHRVTILINTYLLLALIVLLVLNRMRPPRRILGTQNNMYLRKNNGRKNNQPHLQLLESQKIVRKLAI